MARLKYYDGRVKNACSQPILKALYANLNEEQKMSLDGIRWLIIENNLARRSGRTNLLARVFLEQACLYPGQWISIIDHCQYEPAKRNLCLEILHIYNELKDILPNLEISGNYSRIRMTQEKRAR